MQAAVLDTLRCAQTLKAAGFPPEQAEASAQVLGDALADVATKTDLDRHAAMQKADLDRHAAMQKADLERVAAEWKENLDRVAAEQKADLNRVEAKLDTKVDALETKIDAMDQKFKTKLDGVEQKLVEKIDDKFDALNRNILLLNGLVLIMVAAFMAFAFNVMEPRTVSSGEPHVTTHPPAQSTLAAEARPAPPELSAEAARATPPTSPPPQDAPSGHVNGQDTAIGGSL